MLTHHRLGVLSLVQLAAQDQAEKNLLIELTHILERFVPWTPTVGTAQMPLQNSVWVQGTAVVHCGGHPLTRFLR